MSFLGDNIKVHFAGAEERNHLYALKAADIQYRLYSVYKFIYGKNKNDDFVDNTNFLKSQEKEFKHVIQDSGLFTLMFGAGKAIKVDHDFLLEWQDKLIKFVLQNNLKCTCVEIDCQKLLGVEEAWFFRERMRKLLPNRQINVFHYEDGKYGLDRLIEFSDYIAISVPELRILKSKTYKTDAVKLAEYCKKKKPSIDIHMLGCTEYAMLEDISFCTTADSTSWLSGVQYGYINDGVKKGHIKTFRDDLFLKRKKDIIQITEQDISYKKAYKDSTINYLTNCSLCASICKKRYTKLAGSQD